MPEAESFTRRPAHALPPQAQDVTHQCLLHSSLALSIMPCFFLSLAHITPSAQSGEGQQILGSLSTTPRQGSNSPVPPFPFPPTGCHY